MQRVLHKNIAKVEIGTTKMSTLIHDTTSTTQSARGKRQLSANRMTIFIFGKMLEMTVKDDSIIGKVLEISMTDD